MSRSHTRQPSHETEVVEPLPRISSAGSPPRTTTGATTGYILTTTAASREIPRSVPHTGPRTGPVGLSWTPRTPYPRGFGSPSLQARHCSMDSLASTAQPHYSIFPRDIDSSRSATHQQSTFRNPRAHSLMTDSTNTLSPAGLRTTSRQPGQSQIREEGDLHQPEESGLPHSKRFGGDSIVKPEESRVVTSPGVFGPTPAPAGMPIRSRRPRDMPYLLGSASHGTQEQRCSDSTNHQLAFMPLSSPNPEQDLPGRMTPIRDNVRGSSRLPEDDLGHFTTTDADYSPLPTPGIGDSISPGSGFQDEHVQPSQQTAEPALIQIDSHDLSSPFNPGNNSGSNESFVSASPVSTPGLDVTDLQDGLSSISDSNTTSTDLSEYSDPEDISSKKDLAPGSVVTDSLMTDLITCLLLGWLYSSIVLNFPSLLEKFRKCPQRSHAGHASGNAGNRPLMESPRQANNGSIRGESEGESGREDDDQSKQPERNGLKVANSPTAPPRPLACPFHKKDPQRYSGLNDREKEYRNCSSGYWPDISRLK